MRDRKIPYEWEKSNRCHWFGPALGGFLSGIGFIVIILSILWRHY